MTVAKPKAAAHTQQTSCNSVCCASPVWVDDMAAQHPFASTDELHQAAEAEVKADGSSCRSWRYL